MAEKPRAVHLTSVHTAFDKRILHKECKSLAKVGYDVAIIAPSDKDAEDDGVRIRAVSEPRNRLERILFTTRHVYSLALKESADIYHFHDPELIPVGLLLKLWGKRVVYDVHEDLPRQILDKDWIAKPVRRLLAKAADVIEVASARAFDGIVAATPPIARRFPKNKTVVAQNFAVLEELGTSNGTAYAQRENVLLYMGYISVLRGAMGMVEAMTRVPKPLQARLVLAGLFSPAQLESELQQVPGWKHSEFRGWLPRAETVELLAQSRIGLSLFHPAPNYVECYPTKMFEYMAAGIPIIVSDFPLWREIVEKAQCGLLVDPQDPKAIAGAIQWMLENPEEAEAMGKRGRAAVEAQYNWEIEQENLFSLYQKLIRK